MVIPILYLFLKKIKLCIDKSRELGRFYKIALHKDWEGREEMYDEEDNRLDGDIMDAVSTILPHKLMGAIHNDWEDSEPKIERRSLSEFQDMLKEFMQTRKKFIEKNIIIYPIHVLKEKELLV